MRADGRPIWWQPLLDRVAVARREDFSRLPTPDGEGRPAAVLILLAEGEHGPDMLVLQRADRMRTHAGQPAFPGGAADPGEDSAATALREAAEEVGLDPSSVEVEATLPPLWIPVSGFVVTPVLAWWRHPHPVSPIDPLEVARVARVPIVDLVEPANRIRIRHPSGYIGPAFQVQGMVVWGFTAGIISALLDLGGFAREWDTEAPPLDLQVPSDQPVP
jgi:8-oxo-dGTP pyrophosphatase MutT (NUDIX family)